MTEKVIEPCGRCEQPKSHSGHAPYSSRCQGYIPMSAILMKLKFFAKDFICPGCMGSSRNCKIGWGCEPARRALGFEIPAST